MLRWIDYRRLRRPPQGGLGHLRGPAGLGIVGIVIACGSGSAPAGAAGFEPVTRKASSCPGGVSEKASGGSVNEEEVRTGEKAGTEEWFLCSSAGGHPFVFAETGGTEGGVDSSNLAFAGAQAALAWGELSSITELEVVDLAKGRVVYRHSLPEVELPSESTQVVGRIVLKRDDSVAWTELVPGGTYEVIEHTRRGTKTLDDTRTTRPYSLKLKGSTLSWLEHKGEARTATLD